MMHLLRKNLNLATVSINQAALSIGAVVIIIIMTRFLDQATFGDIRYVIAILGIFAFCSLPGVSVVINHHAASMSKEMLRTLVFRQLQWGAYASVGVFLLAAWYMVQGSTELAQAFIVGGVLAPIANLYLVPGLICAGVGKFGKKLFVDSLVITGAIGGVVLGVYFDGTLPVVIGCYLGLQACMTVVSGLLVRTEINRIDRHESSQQFSMQRQFHDGKQITLLQIPFTFLPALEKIIVYLALGPIALALFVIMVLPVEHFRSAFRNLLQMYMLPHINLESPRTTMHWLGVGGTLLIAGIMVLVFFILYGMPLLFESFEELTHLSLLLAVSLLPLPAHIVMVSLIAKRALRTLELFAVITVCLDIIFVTSGALLFGLVGVVVGKIINEIILAILLLFFERKALTEPPV